MKTLTPVALFIFVQVMVPVAPAQTKISKDGRPERLYMPKAGLTANDVSFIRDAARANLFEIRTSEIALKRGQSMFTRQFAKEMIIDHKAAWDELRVLANKRGMDLPKSLTTEQTKMLSQLSKTSTGTFDTTYRNIQLKAHTMTKARLEKQIKTGHNSMVRDYAVKTLPGVTMHLDLAKKRKTMTGPTQQR